MNIGIYGGSFNPIHFGHIGLAQWVLEHTDVEQIWLMVSPSNPLKDVSLLADEQSRLASVAQAVKPYEGMIACNFEFHLPRPNYTVDTLRALSKTYPQHTFTLLIGQDNWELWDKWKDHDYILSNYRIMVYPRHGCRIQPDERVVWLKNAPYFDISSTEIRKNLHS